MADHEPRTPVSSAGSLSSHDEKTSDDRKSRLSLEQRDVDLGQGQLAGKELEDSVELEEARNVALAAALREGGDIPKFSKAAMVIYACTAVPLAVSATSGYDGSLMTAINGMKHYQQEITPGEGSLNKSTSIIFAIYTIGQLAGALTFAGPLSDKFGRRWGMLIGSLVIVLGAALTCSSHDKAQFIGGRFVLGFGIALAIVAAPTYVTECAPPHWRGKIVGCYNSGWHLGAIPAAALTFGTSYINTNWSWRLPLLLQALPATIIIATVLWLPESPRWLYANGKQQEAIDFLVRYHGNGNANHALVKLQIEEFHESIKQDGADKRWWDWRDLVRTHSARWRFAMVAFMAIAGQFSGNGLGYYQLNIYEALGYGYTQRFLMNLGGSLLSALCSITGSLLADRMPRRTVLPLGSLTCGLCLAGYIAAGARFELDPANTDLARTGAAFWFLFLCSFAFTYTPLQSLYPAECLQTEVRAKGVSAKIIIVSAVAFISIYCSPIGLENIAWRYVCVYAAWDVFEAAVWYLIAVETVKPSVLMLWTCLTLCVVSGWKDFRGTRGGECFGFEGCTEDCLLMKLCLGLQRSKSCQGIQDEEEGCD
ncbi:hypothetical protein BT69DRAFT_1355805 [Atractiella rhizophila]|nr:hypothetical protein BT69DRAFT_1355805 [Atractiella rhizophila]